MSGEVGRDQTKSPPSAPPHHTPEKPISSSRSAKPGQNGPPSCRSLSNKGQVWILFVSTHTHAGFWCAVVVLIFWHKIEKPLAGKSGRSLGENPVPRDGQIVAPCNFMELFLGLKSYMGNTVIINFLVFFFKIYYNTRSQLLWS